MSNLVNRLLRQRERALMARIPEPWYAVVTRKEYNYAATLTGASHKLLGYNLILRIPSTPLYTDWL